MSTMPPVLPLGLVMGEDTLWLRKSTGTQTILRTLVFLRRFRRLLQAHPGNRVSGKRGTNSLSYQHLCMVHCILLKYFVLVLLKRI